MKIIVLVKQVPDTGEERKLDPTTGWLDRQASDPIADEINERALEVALQYKDSDKKTEVVVLSMGPTDATQAMRKALSMGADSAVHVLDDGLAGADVTRTAAALAAAVKLTGFDVVIAGNESTDGRAGVVPAMIAEHLGLPLLGSLLSADIQEGSVSGERQGDDGTFNVHAPLPAVVTVTERSAEARFPNFKGIMTAKKKPVTVLSLGELGISAPAEGRSVIVSVGERPPRAAGKKIVDDGNAAAELAEFLVAGRLV
ncbi:electron transfer flavoprotein subunit beta/FixA family protein [Renibacterium salmoninarum]|nr:electron transfer flavoprotein subunit beta/FixA family protein [Renibacterium salmoninarum]